MQEQPKTEPFSKIALDCAESAAHHQRSEGSRLAEALNRSEFIDRALRQAVTRESSRLESGMTWLATVGATAPFEIGEHTSELQSLMRISYAVFCLKKKKHNTKPMNIQANKKQQKANTVT